MLNQFKGAEAGSKVFKPKRKSVLGTISTVMIRRHWKATIVADRNTRGGEQQRKDQDKGLTNAFDTIRGPGPRQLRLD